MHLSSRRDDLVAGFRRNPGPSALCHGDTNNANIFYEPRTGIITAIDLPFLHESMDAEGRPLGSAARDVVASMLSLIISELPLEPREFSDWVETFHQSYRGAGGPGLTPEAVAFFWAVYTTFGLAWWGEQTRDDPGSEAAQRVFQRAVAVAAIDPPGLG